SAVLPVPSCPLSLLPHAITVPLLSSARLWLAPAAIALTPDNPLTCTGTERRFVVPSPSWPEELLPHAITVPSTSRARLCLPPAATAATYCRPLTGTGRSLSDSNEPLPSWRRRFCPQASAL